MNIGISLVGISHLDEKYSNLKDSVGREGRTRKYDCCSENIIEKLIKPFQKNNNVSVYLTTYPNEHIEELIKMYSAKQCLLQNFSLSFMQKTYCESLRQLLDQNLDFIISTRFDILFEKDMSTLNYDYDKMNVLFREKNHNHLNFTCDNYFAFPKKMIRQFSDSIMELFNSGQTNGLHGTVHHLSTKIGYENIKILDKNDQLGKDNIYYYLPHCIFRS